MWRGCHPSALASCPKVSHATVEPQTDVPLQAGDHVTCPNCRVNSIRKEKSLLLGPHGWPQRQRRPPWSGTPFLRAGPWAGCLLGFVTFELHQGHMRWVGLFPQQAGLAKVTWLVSSSWAGTRTQVCWLTAPCSSSSNLLHPTCCQPCNQSYCCSGLEIITAVSTPPTCRVLYSLKDPFIIITSLGPHWSAVGEREQGTAETNMGFGSVSLPLGALLRREVRRGKKPREAGNPPQQPWAISQFLNLSQLIFLFKHYESSWSALFRKE